MANKKIQATATLFLDTKDAQNDAAKFVKDIKQQLLNIETAADKMTVFKDMVEYISQIDKALSALKSKNADAFNKAFGGLDVNLKQVTEMLMGVSSVDIGNLDMIRIKIEEIANSGKKTGHNDTFKQIAKDLNNLYRAMGYEGDKLNLDNFSGGGKFEQKLKLLTDAVEEFGLSFGDISDRIANSFGLEGATNVGKFGQKVREELSKINAEAKEIDLLKTKLNDLSNMKVKINGLLEVSSNLDDSVMSAEELITTMTELYNKLQDRELYANDVDYYKDYVEYMEVAKKIKAFEATPKGRDFLTKQSGEVYDISLEAIEVAEEFASEGKSQILDALDTVEATARSRAREVRLNIMKELGFGSGTGPGDGGSGSPKQTVSYQKLIEKMQEINRLQDELDTNLSFGTDDYNKAEKHLESLKQEFIDLYVASDKAEDALDILNEISVDGMIDFDQFAKICDMISVDMTSGMSQFKETTVEAKSAVDNLSESIKKVYSSSLQLEVDTRNGNASGKEFMNLFGADGIVSTTQGADYQVDTDTLVQQLVANLNRDIVMSLHNHANGDMSFSPSDINSFAKMYYGQGTKINGIIANGFIHTIDFNSIGQEVAIQIAQDYQDGIQHLFEAKNIAQFASFENGSIVPSDLLKQTQASNPEYYQKIIDQLQEAQMTVLRQAFEKNGAEFTLQSFGLDNLDELSNYLISVQKNTQNTIEPVEKLKNLISTLRPSADLSEFTEVFDKFKNGAIDGSQALNQVLDLAPNDISDKTIDETNQKLREQEQLWENVKTAIKNGIGEAVGLDNTVMTLEVIEREIKEGILTSLEECIARFKEFNNISDNGSLKFVGDDERIVADYYGTYLPGYDEVVSKEEADKLRQLSDQQEQLYQNLRSAIKGILSDVVDVDDMTYAFDTIEKEINTGLLTTLDQCIEKFKLLTGLDDKRLTSIRDDQRVADEWDYYQGDVSRDDYEAAERAAEDAQHRAIEAEVDALRYQAAADRLLDEKAELQRENDELREQLLTQTDTDHKSELVQAEVAQLELLQQKLLEVKTAVDAKTQAFEEEYVTVDSAVDAEITSLQSLITQLQEVVAQINLINVGFNNINTNTPKIELKSASVEQSSVATENPYYLTDSRGNRKLMYRGVNGAMSGLVSNRYHGGTFFTDLMSLAKRYAGIDGKVEAANISMKNPLEIDVDGHQWNDIEYLGNGADEASKKIRQCRKELDELSEWALQNIDIKVNLLTDKGFDEFEQEINNMISNDWSDDDQLSKIQRDKFNGYLEAARKTRQEYLDISNADSNVYGLHDTNRFVELAKNSGYDGVVFKNIKDGTNEISNIVVTLQENQIHFIETLKTNFESLLTDFIGHFGKIEDFLSHYNQFKTDGSLFPEIEDDGRDIFREQLEKYEELSILGEPEITNEFLNKNKILGAYDKRVPGGLDDLFALDDVDDRIDAIVSFYLNAIYELEKIQEAFNTKAISVEQYQREQSGNLTAYDKISTVKSGYSDRALNDKESYKYADATIEDLGAKKDQAIAAVNAFKELFANLDMETANPEQLKKVVDSFVGAIKLIDDAQSMATGIVENSIGAPDTAAMRDFHELGPIRDSLTADHLDILQAEAKQIEQIEIDALNAQEQRLKSEQESADIISQKAQAETIPDINAQEEIGQLNQLKTVLDEVKNAVIAKTKAFIDEGDTVEQVVGKEVSALNKLLETINDIVPKVDSLSTKMAGIGTIDFVTKTDVDNTGATKPSTTTEDKFQTRVNAKKGAMTKYINDLKNVQYVTDDARDELIGLRDALDTVKTPKDLNDIIAKFEKLQTEIGILKSSFEKTGLNDIQNVERSLLGSFNTLNIDQKRNLEPERDAVIKQLETYKNAVLNGQKVELSAIENTVKALREKIEVYKEANKEAKNAETAQKKNSKFGDTASRNATAKYNSLMGSANSDQFANSKEITAIAAEYEKAYKAMITLRNELRNSDGVVSESDEAEFKRLTTECNEYAKALDKLIKNTMKLKGNKANPNDYMLGNDFVDDAQGRKQALTDFVKSMYDIDVAAEDFKKDWNEVVFAVDNGDGTFTQMTATFTAARNEIVALAGDTNKVQSKLESFVDGLKNRLQSLSQYFIATVGIYDVWNVVKQGINHVREIDSALTELKKVTNETEASYDNFLQSMAKTGSVIGATVQDLTTMAADWARLGYSMEEAGKLAESTAVLLNVSEFDDATAASEALISTMQAFQYTADESGHVVDILNEIGNNYAVSSDGLAIALQDSASALMEGGNNLEQAVALVAAANRVVQDPNSVGSALRTISLRLRGTSVEV